eukprot:561647-Lingulodinium_polyedra.AAC.1
MTKKSKEVQQLNELGSMEALDAMDDKGNDKVPQLIGQPVVGVMYSSLNTIRNIETLLQSWSIAFTKLSFKYDLNIDEDEQSVLARINGDALGSLGQM